MQFSKYQNNIFAKVKTNDNLFVQAVAGSGKSTTLFRFANLLPANLRVLFLSFNKSIQLHAEEKLADTCVEAMTFHKYGLSVMRQQRPSIKIDYKKIDNLVEVVFPKSQEEAYYANNNRFDKRQLYPITKFYIVRKVLMTIRTLALPVESAVCIRKYLRDEKINLQMIPGDDLSKFEFQRRVRWAVKHADEILTLLNQSDSLYTIMDLTDMVRLPCVNNLIRDVYDLILVDEAQDIDPYQLNMIGQLATLGARIVAVGDRKQAIYAFKGSIAGVVDQLIKTHNMTELPLSITYRCKRVISEHVNKTCNAAIEAKDAGGTVIDKDLTYYEDDERVLKIVGYVKEYSPGFLISPTNGMLLVIWIELLKHGVAAKFKDTCVIRDIQNLIKKYKTVEEVRVYLIDKIDKYEGDDLAISETRYELLFGILALMQHVNIRSMEDFEALIKKMKDVKSDLFLHTVHSSKGLETKTVILVHNWFGGSQLENMKYVAMTRASNKLINVYCKKQKKGKNNDDKMSSRKL